MGTEADKKVISEHMSMIARRRWANMTDEDKERQREASKAGGQKGAKRRWNKEDNK